MVSEQTWEQVLGRSAAEFARDAEDVRRQFWAKAKRLAAGLPFAEDLVTAYYCAFDRATPLQVKAALGGALAYFILPYDLMPDMLPALGFVDDAAVLATAIRMVAAHIRPEHRDAARAALARGMQAEG
jgi:uncharacterized membrane protein YkvA (DUF1232 family)